MFARKLPRFAGMLVFAYLLAACSWLNQPTDEVSQRQQQWADQNVTSYRYTIQVGCFCLTSMTQPVVVEVRDGETASLTPPEGGEPVPAELFTRYDTIDDLFALLKEAREQNYAEATAEFDAERGFPTSIRLDGSTQVADDETFYTISNFEVLQ